MPALDPAAVARFVAAAPHGIYRRRLWLFYEWLTGRRLPLPDLASGSYIDLVPADECHLPARRRLVAAQNEIVDPRFQEPGFRATQNYVGETVHLGRERVHYVCPPPEAVPALMAGLIAADARLDDEAIHPVIHATTIGYGFVFIHPFEDGNGRLHRFLIHNILATRGFTPLEVMVPISAAMLRDRAGYDRSLEDFSRPLLDLIDYTLDADGRMHVTGDHEPWYRYPDLTRQTEAVFRFVAEALERDLPEELAFLASYDRARESMRRVLDLPDRAGDLFIRLVNQNGGPLSAAKRHSSFACLTDDEIARLAAAVGEAFATPPTG